MGNREWCSVMALVPVATLVLINLVGYCPRQLRDCELPFGREHVWTATVALAAGYIIHSFSMYLKVAEAVEHRQDVYQQ